MFLPTMCCNTAAIVALCCLVLERANKSQTTVARDDRPSPFADWINRSTPTITTKTGAMLPNLHTLPPEIVQQIASYVPVSALISLKLASPRLFLQLPAPPQGYVKTASRCEIKSIRRYVGERAEARGGRRKCILCDGLMPIVFFRDPGLPVCKWHDGWFSKSAASLSAVLRPDVGQTDIMASESEIARVLCAHCKVIRGWDAECCICKVTGDCESCGVWDVNCHLRR